jgi:hypothetical protein
VTVPLFEASHRLGFLDYFRVPYRVASPLMPSGPGGALHRFCGHLWVAPDHDLPAPSAPRGAAREDGSALEPRPGSLLWWLRADVAGLPAGVTRCGRYELGGIPVFCRVVPDRVASRWLTGTGNGWRPIQAIRDGEGNAVASVWRDANGSMFLPFDPAEAMHRLWSERYDAPEEPALAGLRPALLKSYYAVRPALPRPVQISLRRMFTRIQRRATFPRWPVETALLDLYDWLFGQLAGFAGHPVPWLDLWPNGYSWALILTHDVETAVGCRDLHLLRDVERQLGYTSSWNFVPLRYEVADEILTGLRDEGCEIGVHGLLHDGRDLASRRLLERRLAGMRRYAARWQAVGFRAPATQRVWEWMPLLGFDYDSSYHDTAPYEPTPGGCCSYFPFFNESLVELPITLPQDHTLFVILRQPDASVWIEKARHVRSRRGMALALTHPDYARDPRLLRSYRRLLEWLDDDPRLWRALPREVSAWWRRRAESTLEQGPAGWTVQGPAALDGTVRFAYPDIPTLAADTRPSADDARAASTAEQ